MKKILLSCITLLFCISLMAQNTASLKMNLEKNKVYRLNAVSEQTILQTVNGNQQTVETKINYTASIKMVDATADFMITEVRFDSLITNTNTMGKAVNISSVGEGNIKSAETAEVMSYIMNRLTKNAIYAKMDFSGKVLDIVNAKMVSDLIMKDTTSITLTGPVKAAVISQITNLVSAKSLITMVEMFTHFIPGRPVTTGESWNVSEVTNSGGMTLEIATAYRLDGISGNNANITSESNIKAAANALPMQSGAAKITYDDIKGLSKSSLVIDVRTGLLVEDKAKSHITGNLGVSGPGFSMQIPMDINSESKVISLK